MKLIAGLGNPGRSYARHRHNIGFLVLDALAGRHGIAIRRRSFGSLIGNGVIGDEAALLAKPQTFMNLSGDSIAPLLGYYRLSPENLVVVHDDIDLNFGQLKITRGAGHGGHNGVSSVIEALGDKDFFRVRVGVGRPPEGTDGADYVLSPFEDAEIGEVGKMIERSADAIEMLIEEGLEAAQQKYH